MIFLRILVLYSALMCGFCQDTNIVQCSEASDEKKCMLDIIAKQNSIIENQNSIIANLAQSCARPEVPAPENCKHWLDRGYAQSGIYTILPPLSEQPFNVYCDMTTNGGGWTVIQKRFDGSVDFVRNWVDYANGFGDLDGEHWIGNSKIHALTFQGDQELRIELTDWEGESAYARYGYFKVASEQDKFQLLISSYDGTAGDSLSAWNGQYFTTQDRDNDNRPSQNCATRYESGGFWFDHCFGANLNGRYLSSSAVPSTSVGIIWGGWRDHSYSLKTAEMKIRPSQ